MSNAVSTLHRTGLAILLPATFVIATWFVPAFGAAAELVITKSIADADRREQGEVRATVKVDLTRSLSINGSEKLRREAYFNVHGTPAELTESELEWLTGDLRASFGRSMGAVSSFMKGLTEDPSRPGFAEPDSLASQAAAAAERRAAYDATDLGPVEIVNSVHPYSYYGKEGEQEHSDDTFVPGSHAASAEIISAFFKSANIDREPYFEVANECNVHARKLGTTIEDMCDLHTAIARRLREDVPGLKVGGPTLAWPAFEFDDFRIWREQMGVFIERAAAEMDFLSVHLYTTHWDSSTKNRFGANTDAILDLIETQSLLTTGEVKPLLISECGTGLRSGEKIMEEYSPHRDWLILRGANHVFLSLLKRDDRIIKMIPFLTLKATWYKSENPYPWVLFHKLDEGWVPTHLVKWFEFWKDIEGQHIPAACTSLDVQTHAVVNGSTAYLVMDNLVDSSVQLDVREITPDGIDVVSATVSRMYFDGSEPVLTANRSLDSEWRHLELQPHETAVIRLQLTSEPELKKQVVESVHYADRTLQKASKEPAYFQISCPADLSELDSATLRVGFGRSKSKSMQPHVLVNGKAIAVPEDERGQRNEMGSEFFTTKEINVPTNILRKSNRVAVSFPDNGGHVSSVVLVIREENASDKAELSLAKPGQMKANAIK